MRDHSNADANLSTILNNHGYASSHESSYSRLACMGNVLLIRVSMLYVTPHVAKVV